MNQVNTRNTAGVDESDKLTGSTEVTTKLNSEENLTSGDEDGSVMPAVSGSSPRSFIFHGQHAGGEAPSFIGTASQ